MKTVILVGIGGALGAVARYFLGGAILHHTPHWKISTGTLTVNILGCLIAGVLAGLIEKHGYFSADTRLFLFTGILGGFTTFSALGIETVTLLRRGDAAWAGLYVALSVVCGMAALWAGLKFVAAAWK